MKSISLYNILEMKGFPKYQDTISRLVDYNPMRLTLFVSHRWINDSTATNDIQFNRFVFKIKSFINQLITNKIDVDDHVIYFNKKKFWAI
jgi:predicted sulfurtransferase